MTDANATDENAPRTGVDFTWHIMSVAVLHEDKDVSDEYRAFFPRALRYTRLVTAVGEVHGAGKVTPLYDALGELIHPGGSEDPDTVIPAALSAVGLPAGLARYAGRDEFDVRMREPHCDGISRVGQDGGTPVIAVNGVAFFGPVISPAPRGRQALDLWDGVTAVSPYDGFLELKRSRTRDPIFE